MKEIVLTIEDNGDLTFLDSSSADAFLDLGETTKRRASHILPVTFIYRQWFRILRTLFGEKGRVAEWTRRWNTAWIVDARPIGGPRFPQHFANRQDAIDFEVDFLVRWFGER
jgi:hypothetical protein